MHSFISNHGIHEFNFYLILDICILFFLYLACKIYSLSHEYYLFILDILSICNMRFFTQCEQALSMHPKHFSYMQHDIPYSMQPINLPSYIRDNISWQYPHYFLTNLFIYNSYSDMQVLPLCSS